MDKRMMATWTRLAREAWQTDRRQTVLVLVATTVHAAQPAVRFWALARLIDLLASGMTGGSLDWKSGAIWGGVMVLSMLLRDGAKRAVDFLRALLSDQIEERLSGQVLERAVAVPLAQLERPEYHDRLQRARQALSDRLKPALDDLSHVLVDGLMILFSISALASLHPMAAVLLLVTCWPAHRAQAKVFNEFRAMYRRHTEPVRRADYMAKQLTERRYGAEVRLLGLTGYFTERWRMLMQPIMRERLRFVYRLGSTQAAMGVLNDLALVGTVGLLGFQAVRGAITVGGLGAAVDAAQVLQERSRYLLVILGQMQQNAGFLNDIWSLIDEEVPKEEGGEGTVQAGPLAVELKDVSFTYPGTPAPTLRSINLTFRPGEVVALVGENGAGKSTLVKLLLGLYTPDDGAVMVGGADMASRAGRAVAQRIAPVFQDYARYALTVGENIGVGWVERLNDQERIGQSARAAGADGFVAALPGRFGTPLGREFDGGHDLSGGQWQRLALGRAHMRDAGLLVLDEPTAALDPEAELDVFRQFRSLAQGKTAVFISHRLGAARLADRVVVLKDGRVIEDGHHDELIAKGGEYAELFAAQAHLYRASVA